MFDNHKTFIGIDPTGGRRPFTFAALDHDLHLTAMRQGSRMAAALPGMGT